MLGISVEAVNHIFTTALTQNPTASTSMKYITSTTISTVVRVVPAPGGGDGEGDCVMLVMLVARCPPSKSTVIWR